MSRIKKEKVTVRALNISQDKLDFVQKVLASDQYGPYYKKSIFKETTGYSTCCICSGISSLERVSEIGDSAQPLIRLERFCQACFDTQNVRTSEEPSTSKKDLAAYYGIEIGEPNVKQQQ